MKTEFLLFYSKNTLPPPPFPITIGDAATPPPSQSARNLVVIFDDCLSLHPHISAIYISVFFHLHRISCIHKFLPLPAAKNLVHSFISSRLDYCNDALSGLPECDLQKIQCVHNAATHLITHTRKHKHVTPILIELHWLLVMQGILLEILVLTDHACNNSAPPYIQYLLIKQTPTRSLCTSSKFTLQVPHSNTLSYIEHAFSRFAPAKYHLLPKTVK